MSLLQGVCCLGHSTGCTHGSGSMSLALCLLCLEKALTRVSACLKPQTKSLAQSKHTWCPTYSPTRQCRGPVTGLIQGEGRSCRS